jgi:histidinol dehydrogenase
MLAIYELAEARQTILKRQSPGDAPVPAAVTERLEQLFGQPTSPTQAVAEIIRDVRERQDSALVDWTERLDGSRPTALKIERSDLAAAWGSLSSEQRAALQCAKERIESFYRRQPLISWVTQDLGGTLGQLIRPIRMVGLYVPGGSAPLPSSVLMSAVPARVAGVVSIAMCTPPERSTGKVAPITLAAAYCAGVDEVYPIGGAQAIAALAYGTQTIARVDKIFGPGNLFVTLAKQQVFGVVGIDGLAGPTETVVIADESANPTFAAADLLAQAEHDPMAAAILITPSRRVAAAVRAALETLLATRAYTRQDIIRQSLDSRGGVVLVADLAEAVAVASEYAPEHLALSVADPWRWSNQVTAAGGIFLGENSFEVLGDYIAGPSHVMPTAGTARFASPLNLWDFVRIISLVGLDAGAAQPVCQTAAVIARGEGLTAHAIAAELRLEAKI